MGIQYNTIENVPVASFETSWKNESANQPIKSVVAEITPTQDLHGYDYPWPAGGGKNKIDQSKTYQQGTNQLVLGQETVYSTRSIFLTAGTYTVSVALSGGKIASICLATDSDTGGSRIGNTNAARSFTLESDSHVGILLYNANGITASDLVSVQLESGSTATAWTPYSNICPITGKTEATVWRTGVNVWDEEWEVGGVNTTTGGNWNTSDRIRSKNYVPVVGNTAYLLTASANINIVFYDSSKSIISSLYYYPSDGASFTTPVNCSFIRFATQPNYGTTYNSDISINYPATDHDYHAYIGSTYPISWQSEAGTVYGGTVDVVSGELVVDRAIVDLGDLAWTAQTDSQGQFFRSLKPQNMAPIPERGIPDILCTVYPVTVSSNVYDCSIAFSIKSGVYIFVRDTRYNDATAYKTAIAGQMICYALATPQTYQLTGAQISTLLGLNNVWADSGNIKKLMWQYTIFDLLRVFINGFEITDFIAFGGWQRERGDVDGPEAGRTLDARMHRARVATKMRYNVTCRPLLVEELSSLERLIMPEYVTVKVIGDPFYGTWEKTCYVNNTSAKYLIRKRNGAQWWGGITFPIIEV